MEISITWNICRVCLEEEQKNTKNSSGGGQQMKLLFCDNSKIAQQIYECSGITMKPNDSLPEKICRKCLSILKYAVNFRKTCRESDNYLQSILQRTKSASKLIKPERSTDIDDDEAMSDDPLSNNDEEETGVIHFEDTEDELDNAKTTKRKRNEHTTKQSKKLKSLDFSKPTALMIAKEQHTDDEEQVVENASNVHQDKIELDEEIVETPEDMIDHLFSNMPAENPSSSERNIEEDEVIEETEDQKDSKKDLKYKTSNSEEFYSNNSFSKMPNDPILNKIIIEDTEDHDEITVEAHEADVHELKQENDDLYYLLKDKNHPTNSDTFPPYEEHSHQIEEHIVETDNHERDETDDDDDADDNVEFLTMEEEEEEERQVAEEELDEEDLNIMMQLKNEIDDNQSQVTSTVVTKEDDDANEENSNLSSGTNELTYEYIIDEYAIEDIQSKNSSQSLNTNPQKIAINSNKKITQTILRGRKRTASSSTGAQIFVCDICGNHFTNRQLMNAHMKVHRQEKNHECEICFKRFITACNLQAHMRIHTGEKPFECQYCGRRFNDRSSNLRHERTHTNEKPFHCDLCGKTFALATTLQAHLKVHTGERSYRCEPCAKSFKLPHQLKAHRNTTLHKAVEQLGKNKN